MISCALCFDAPCDKTKRPPSGNDPFWPLAPLEEAKFEHRYGYYECRCKLQKFPEEWWSAFWTQSTRWRVSHAVHGPIR